MCYDALYLDTRISDIGPRGSLLSPGTARVVQLGGSQLVALALNTVEAKRSPAPCRRPAGRQPRRHAERPCQRREPAPTDGIVTLSGRQDLPAFDGVPSSDRTPSHRATARLREFRGPRSYSRWQSTSHFPDRIAGRMTRAGLWCTDGPRRCRPQPQHRAIEQQGCCVKDRGRRHFPGGGPDPVLGSYSSAEKCGRGLVALPKRWTSGWLDTLFATSPPATSTVPSGSSVAVCQESTGGHVSGRDCQGFR